MPKYMLLLGGADLDKRSSNEKRNPEILERYMQWLQTLKESGHYVASHKLYDQTGKRLTVRGGEIVEGPFVESKEAVGGLFIIEAPSLEEATAVAKECPVLRLQNGYAEIRVVEEVRPGNR
jgi:hypothetical protein